MRKKLKLGFAMGGGVSLGTFSGSALTETIKQFMVYGKDEDGEDYDEVIIDVFSGASAGAMSLLVMLRGLYQYEDKLMELISLDRFKNLTSKEAVKQKIKDHLAHQFRRAYHQMDDEKKEKLIAVQATQELQRLTWVKEANINKIARLDDDEIMLSKGSILDRDFMVYDMASKAIYFENDEIAAAVNNKPKGPLADRVLFACTLTRVEPRLIKSEKFFNEMSSDNPAEIERKKKLNKLYDRILSDGASSKTHKDMRIFDITFDNLNPSQVGAAKKYPPRWINVHTGDSVKHLKSVRKSKKLTKDIWSIKSSKGSSKFRQENTWIEMVCTAMAAGSFPMAFEPVILKRYYSELTRNEKEVLDKNNQEFARFTYIDGGTFNNEPISEAFKLAGFIDNQDFEGIQGQSFDRKIIFVDPNLGEASTINNFDYLREYKLNPQNKKATKRTGLEKLVQLVPPIISLLRNEGSVVELDKSKEIINKFELNANLKRNYEATIRNGFPLTFDSKSINNQDALDLDNKIVEMRKQVIKYLRTASNKSLIPRTYRNLPLAIRKHIVNDISTGSNYFQRLHSQTMDIENIAGYQEFFNSEKPFSCQPSNFQDWLILLYFTLLELSQDLVEKNKLSRIIPIGPVSIKGGKIENVQLKGSGIAAFYGFFAEEYRTHDFNKGIYSAIEICNFLNKNNRGNRKQQLITLQHLLPEKEVDKNIVNEKLNAVIKKRIFDELLKNNLIESITDNSVHKNIVRNLVDKVNDKLITGYLNIGINKVESMIENAVNNGTSSEGEKEILLEFRIKISKELKSHVITDDKNSKWISDIKPVFIKEDYDEVGAYYFIIILRYKFTASKGVWYNWEDKKISYLKIAKNRKILSTTKKLSHKIVLPDHAFVKSKLEDGLYNYFKLNLSDIKAKGEKEPWEKSKEEASSLAGLIFGKRRNRKNK